MHRNSDRAEQARDTWRGHDLTERKRKIVNAMNLGPVSRSEDVPLIVNSPCYFAFASNDKPADYFTNPDAMLRYQETGWEKHLARVHDDAVPYFMPWYGTGVLASAFGAKVVFPERRDADPATAGPVLDRPTDVARLKAPDPERSGLMPKVLSTIAWAKEHSDIPVGLTDMNSPLSTAAQLAGYDKLFVWMYDEPAAVHDLMDLVADAFIAWTRAQKKCIGEPLDCSNGLQGTWSPPGIGVWASDDDLVSVGPDHYREFVVPRMERVFAAFGGGSLHFCGNGSHQAANIAALRGVRAVNNSPMGNVEAFHRLRAATEGRIAIQLQDSCPLDPAAYYRRLFSAIQDVRGVMLVSFVLDTMGTTEDGRYRPVEWDPLAAANKVVDAIRSVLRERCGALT